MGSFAEERHAHTHVLKHTLSYVNSMSLKCAVELGVADIIHGHGKRPTLSELAAKLSIPPAKTGCFRRLMLHLVHSGFFARSTNEENEEVFGLTAVSKALLETERGESLSSFVLFILSPVQLDPWQSLSRWIREDDEAPTVFELVHGKGIYEVTKHNAQFNRVFNEGMAGDTRFVAQVLIRECGDDVFGGVRSLVDVGGGTGAMALAIAEAFPHVKCTVFDLPHVVAPLMEGSCKKVGVVGGDMFEGIPRADAVLLKWVLHCWGDEDCVRILQKCKEAIPSKKQGGKVIIVEMVMNLEYCTPELAEAQLLCDVHMMGPVPGKERSEVQWRDIFAVAGFLDYKMTPLMGQRSVIELYY